MNPFGILFINFATVALYIATILDILVSLFLQPTLALLSLCLQVSPHLRLRILFEQDLKFFVGLEFAEARQISHILLRFHLLQLFVGASKVAICHTSHVLGPRYR